MSTGADARTERITADLARVTEPLGLVVEDVTVTSAGKRRIVWVLVDHVVDDLESDQSVPALSLDEVGEATRVVSDALDASDAMGEQPYVLEVSSPGTDRPLTQPRHFRRNVGRLVDVALADGGKFTGRITRTTADAVELNPGDGQPQLISYHDIAKARVQVEFNRPDGKDS